MITSNDDNASTALSLWQRTWPFAGLTLALAVNVLWIGALRRIYDQEHLKD